MVQPPLPDFRKVHLGLVRAYADRHFTDPDVRLEDVAIFHDLSERTLRESLRVNRTSWRDELLARRLDRGEQLLKETTFRIAEVARLSGYRSAPAFAKVFQERFRLTPRQFRRGAGGRARAGGPTGASFLAGRRARGEKVAVGRKGTGLTPGQRAIEDQKLAETEQRLSDMDGLGERTHRRYDLEELLGRRHERLRDRPDYWRSQRRDFEAWVEENDRPVGQPVEGDTDLRAFLRKDRP